MRRFTLTCTAAIALAAASLANAGGAYTQLSTTVSYAELDMQSPAGVETMYRRLGQAAETVCRPLEGRAAWLQREHRQCLSEALGNAVTQMNQPLLTPASPRQGGRQRAQPRSPLIPGGATGSWMAGDSTSSTPRLRPPRPTTESTTR